MNRNHKRAAAGYTLIELMLVVVIFSILLSIVLPRYGGLVIKANQAKAKSNLGALRTTISIYYSETEGHFPLAAYPVGSTHYTSDGLSFSVILAPRWIDKVPMPLLRDMAGGFNGMSPASWDAYVSEAMSKEPPDDVLISNALPGPTAGFPAPYVYDNARGTVFIPNGNFEYAGSSYFYGW